MTRSWQCLGVSFFIVLAACGDDRASTDDDPDADVGVADVGTDASSDTPPTPDDVDRDDVAADVCTSDCTVETEQIYTLEGAVSPTVSFDGALEFSRDSGAGRCMIRWPLTSEAAVRTCEVCDWAFVLDVSAGAVVDDIGGECATAGIETGTWDGQILSVGYGQGQTWFDVDGRWVAGPGTTTFGNENGRDVFRYQGAELP